MNYQKGCSGASGVWYYGVPIERCGSQTLNNSRARRFGTIRRKFQKPESSDSYTSRPKL